MNKDELRKKLDVRSKMKNPWIEARPENLHHRGRRGPQRKSFCCINQERNPGFPGSLPPGSPASCSLLPAALFFSLSLSRLTSHFSLILALPVSCSLTPAALFFSLSVSRLTSHFSLILALPVSCSLTPAALFFGLSISRLTSHVSRSLFFHRGPLPCA